MPFETVDRPAVEKMVRGFYTIVLKDDLIGPIFVRKLGNDLKNDKWYEHLNTLYNFWMMMMTGEKNYWGDPFPPHVFIGPLSEEMFERWLKLFQGVVQNLFIEELADKFYKKAEILAGQFIENLGINDDDDEWD
jgi:hemoglobin